MKLSTLDRMALRKAVRAHPDLQKHVAKPGEVNSLAKEKLISLAEALGLNIEAVVRAGATSDGTTTEEWLDQVRDGEKNPPFTGSVPFELVLELFGRKVIRQARVNYAVTPEWDYFDLRAQEIVSGVESSSVDVEVLTEPESRGYELDGRGKLRRYRPKPEWTRLDLVTEGVLPEEVIDEFYRLADEDALRQDAERRARAGVSQ